MHKSRSLSQFSYLLSFIKAAYTVCKMLLKFWKDGVSRISECRICGELLVTASTCQKETVLNVRYSTKRQGLQRSDGSIAVIIDLSLVRFSTGLAKAVVESKMRRLRGTITDWV